MGPCLASGPRPPSTPLVICAVLYGGTRDCLQFTFKLSEIKNPVPQLCRPHFKCSVATRGWWLPRWAVQIWDISTVAGNPMGQTRAVTPPDLGLC